MKTLIGITGYARSGKDFFAKNLAGFFTNVKIMALAMELKKRIAPFIKDEFGLDVWNCTPQEKELIRPMFVAFGKVHRDCSNGTYWTNILENSPEWREHDIIIVSDIRFDEKGDGDEYGWLKKHGGLLISIERTGITAPNEEELVNFPKLKSKADLTLQVPFLQEGTPECKKYFEDIFNVLKCIQASSLSAVKS